MNNNLVKSVNTAFLKRIQTFSWSVIFNSNYGVKCIEQNKY